VILGIPKRMLIIIAVLVGIGLIYVAGADKQSAGATGGSPTGCKVTVVADVLNARSAPDATAGIVGKYNKDAQVDAQPVVQDGFRKIADGRWAKTEFMQPVAGSKCG
jgi:hypothetical protein